ncbi:ExbD/TolR family protein [Desulfovibrio subterraneus]|jgi:biopolymer transport protein TolR|uniref:Protein TolR n=1 Tax=Desulfovibrio subterraneus TaxID=2718620 RepID=A0A7J0BEW2_9BACT|nr:ExbD/TolR family protein [Desulfovibrio subterraneus]GFM32250.1 protein TolR [Desulfovibrio subterraneus]
MGASVGNSKGFVAEINVTPFVDVMLVLLIIFMVTAPLMTQGLEVDLPQTQTVEVLPTDSEHLVMTIRRDGAMFLDEYPVTFDDLEGHIIRLVKEQNKQLFLRADREVPYGVVVQAMGHIKAAGIANLGVVAEQPDEPKDQKKTK